MHFTLRHNELDVRVSLACPFGHGARVRGTRRTRGITLGLPLLPVVRTVGAVVLPVQEPLRLKVTQDRGGSYLVEAKGKGDILDVRKPSARLVVVREAEDVDPMLEHRTRKALHLRGVNRL